jgi:hypothetical protein
MTLGPLAASDDIEKITQNILTGSKAYGVFPTPVDKIVAYSELTISQGVDLGQVEPSFFDASRHFFGKVTRKVLGIIDFKEKTIYLDHTQKTPRKNFIKLHEVGHGVMPWQKKLLGCKDDEETILPDECKVELEREASFFASASLFQLDRFNEEAAKLPLSIRSARALGQKFGGSVQATLRRYVERSPKRCALLVFHKTEKTGPFPAKVRNYFESQAFTKAFGGLTWPDECGHEFEFVKDIQRGRKDHDGGQIAVTTSSLEQVTLQYHFFNSSYNVFVLFFPAGEKIASRVKILSRV